ncbi:MAG: peptidase S8 [Anaerolinea sp.]|nr:peptidase S8 [Anaerolinea sp.]
MTVQITIDKKPNKGIGCGLIVLTILGFIWVILFSGLDLFINWVSEQAIMEVGERVPDFRWITHIVTSVLILVVCLLMAWLVKEPRIKWIFRLWSFAAFLAVLSTPSKLLWLAEQNLTAIFQLAVLFLMIAGSNLLVRKKESESDKKPEKTKFPGMILFVSSLFYVPWLLWGALGSWLDTLLEIVIGILFAWFAVKFIFEEYLEKVQASGGVSKLRDVLFDGLVVAVFLLISVAALAINGSQQMLVVTVPIAGWLVAIFSSLWKTVKGQDKLSAGIILGVIFTLPLVFFDMDELNAIFTGGAGETLEWANKAAWFTFMAILMITLVLLTNLKSIHRFSLPKSAHLGFAVIGLIGIVIIYSNWGQVGFFGDKQFIILKQQADLSKVGVIPDYAARRTAVYEELVKTAETTQADLRARLDKMDISYSPYYLVNGIEINGGILTKMILMKDPSVDRILDSPQLRPLPQPIKGGTGEISNLSDETLWNISMIRADQVVNELGVTGEGILIGQTDSGVDGRHPELAAAYRGAATNGDFNWYDPWNNTPFPTDISGHGTETLGIMLGQNTGVAPGAQWIGCVNLARNQGNPAVYLDCMQFMLAPFPHGGNAFSDGEASKGAMIINNSWGCPDSEGCDSNVFLPAVDALKKAGIFMSVAAGNTGYYGCDTVMDPPAIYSEVFSSGSVNQQGNISAFSSLDSYAIDNPKQQKPEILAPGEDVISSYPGGAYSMVSGTSFAAPHVSGVVALMWSANPKLIGNIDQTTKILIETSQDYQGQLPNCVGQTNQIESGLIDAYKAVQAAIAWQP